MTETISLYEFFQKFPNEEAARVFFEAKRWPSGVSCAHCGSFSVAECVNHVPMPYRCRECRRHFSVRTGTVLTESKLPLNKWLMAIYIMTTARKGIPSAQMARELGITQKSAWFLAQRIRKTWMGQGGADMGPTVEMDETYIGGKNKNRHSDKEVSGGGSFGKAPVISIKDRNGEVRATSVASTSKPPLHGFIHANVRKGATVITDELPTYRGMRGYTHLAVNHSAREFVPNQAHTSGIESFWAILKCGYNGIYHYMRVKHLHRYVNEFSFRHNTSKVSTLDFMAMTIAWSEGKRLSYQGLIHAA
jgi:transposase-like protein